MKRKQRAMKFKVFSVLVWLVLLTMLLGLVACGKRKGNGDVGVFEGAPCPMELPPSVVEGQDIVCGYVNVPEEHANPDGDTIRLAVAVIKSTSDPAPAPDPLVVESGGPGVSTLASAPAMLSVADLRARRDVVLVEQRGTLYSEPYLLCEEVLAFVTGMFSQDWNNEEEEIKAFTACRDRLVAKGVNLSAYDSLENAADIVMVLTALGYDEFNFYGISYATMLAQHIMRDHPDRLRSVILDGVDPLSVNGFVQLPNSADRAFRLLFESCAAAPLCDAHFPDLETFFFDLVNELDENPITVNSEGPGAFDVLVTGDRLIWQLFQQLSHTPISLLPARIYAVADGDYDLVTSLGAAYLPNSLALSAMSTAVMCAEGADYTEADFDLEGLYPQVAAVVRDGFDIRDYCAVLNVEPLGDDADAPVVSDVPTLVMSGAFDPVTLPGNGDVVAETLSNSYVYTFPGIGHGAANSGVCPRSIMVEFLDDPTHEPDASCIAEMELQFVVPTEGMQLEPFADAEYGVRGVLPAGWAKIGSGFYAHLNANGDLTVLEVVKLPDLPLDWHITPRLQQLGIGELPQSSGRYETTALTWDWYTFEGYWLGLGGAVVVDYAIASSGTSTVAPTDAAIYLVGLYAPPDEYEALHEAVFVPVVDGLNK